MSVLYALGGKIQDSTETGTPPEHAQVMPEADAAFRHLVGSNPLWISSFQPKILQSFRKFLSTAISENRKFLK